jgi:hypothetical protein
MRSFIQKIEIDHCGLLANPSKLGLAEGHRDSHASLSDAGFQECGR